MTEQTRNDTVADDCLDTAVLGGVCCEYRDCHQGKRFTRVMSTSLQVGEAVALVGTTGKHLLNAS